MPRIHRLSSEVIDRIAAGEVVERPASVVKELLENALDAGATRIEVEIDGGGIERILVRDDGGGMSAEDARLALERHATSKITSDADLSGVASYGFRGEALPSIASVSRLTLTSSDGSSPEAVRIRVAYGMAAPEEPAARPAGHRRARRGALRAHPRPAQVPRVARGRGARRRRGRDPRRALQPVRRFLRCAPRNRETLDAPAAVDRAARILQVFGRETLGELESTSRRGPEPPRLRGFATRGSVTFPSRRFQYLFVNGRPVEDRALSRAIRQASRDAIRTDRHPGALPLRPAEPGAVDVNVSPAKTQVRFADAGTAYRLVYHALHSALLSGKEERRLRSVPARPPVVAEPSEPDTADRRPRRLRERPVGVPPIPRPEAPPAPRGEEDARHRADRPAPRVLHPRVGPGGPARDRPARRARADPLRAHPGPRSLPAGSCRSGCSCGPSSKRRRRRPRRSRPGSTTLTAAGFEIEPMSGRSYAIAALPAEATDRDPGETLREALAGLAETGDPGPRASAATAWPRASPADPPSRSATTSRRRRSGGCCATG